MNALFHKLEWHRRLPVWIFRALSRRGAIIVLLCLAALFSVTFIQAFLSPGDNRILNPGFEWGSMSPWFRDGNAQWVTVYGCDGGCGQHETFFWPHGARHGWSRQWNTGDRWWGEVWNQNQSGNQYGALAQGITLTPNQRYRLSAWMVAGDGALGYLRWYANGVTYLCAGSVPTGWPGNHVIWPIANNLSCEFTPSNTSGFNVHMAAYVDTGEWVIADDWALTQLVDVPRLDWPRLPLPISYWARDYSNSVDRAVANWEAATGRDLFVKAASEPQAQLIIDGVAENDLFCNGYRAEDNAFFGVTYYPGRCIGPYRQLIELNTWYLNRWSREPKESVIGHELGHVLGLDDVELVRHTCQLMLGQAPIRYDYCGVVRPTSKDASSVP